MSLETRVLVNGRWVTRVASLEAILSANQEDSGSIAEEEKPEVPSIGLLSQTVLHSPVVNFIVPARIRVREKNDVVFVGEDMIQVRELKDEGHFEDVATKTDFGSRIRAARSLHLERRQMVSGLDDFLLKKETADVNFNTVSSSKNPTDLLILTLESNDLVFLYGIEGSRGNIEFVTRTYPLPKGRSHLESTGKHLAVEPRSRAVAVAAWEGNLTIFATNFPSSPTDGTSTSESLDQVLSDPVKAERHFLVDGVILKMEFLYPDPHDERHVILLLIICKDQRTRLVCYEWDCTTDLRTARRLGDAGHPVGNYDKMPLLLIPLTISSAFMLVTEKVFSVYTGILTGAPTHARVEYFPDDKPLVRGSSRKFPVYVHWARPIRHEGYSESHDDLYLCREDGIVRSIEVNRDQAMMINATWPAGRLGCNVGTAFAGLDMGLDFPDMLVAAGDMSPGGLFMCRARKDPQLVELIHNWSPMLDLTTKTDAFEGKSTVPTNLDATIRRSRHEERLFVCSGRSDYGTISELRHGLEASIEVVMEYSLLQGLINIWSLPDIENGGTSFLLSFPTYSTLIRVTSDLELDSNSDERDIGLDLESSTIAVGMTSDGSIIQVTERSIKAISTLDHCAPFSVSCRPIEKIVSAIIHHQSSSFIHVVRCEDTVELYFSRVVRQDNKLFLQPRSSSFSLSSVPSCLSIQEIGDDIFVLVGTTEGMIQLLMLRDSGFETAFEQPLNRHILDGAPTICESITALPIIGVEGSVPRQMLLLCGLRSGLLNTYAIKTIKSDSNPELGQNVGSPQHSDVDWESTFDAGDSFDLGPTPVRFLQERFHETGLIVLGGRGPCRVTYDIHKKRIAVTSILLSDSENASYKQPDITAATQVHGLQGVSRKPGGLLAFVSNDSLIITAISYRPGMVVRRLKLKGTPRRLIYSKRLGMLVVATTDIEVTHTHFPGTKTIRAYQRIIRPSIKLLDPDSPDIKRDLLDETDPTKDNADDIHRIARFGLAGERIFSLIEWTCHNGQNTYHYFALGMGKLEPGNKSKTGRIVFLRAKQNKEKGWDINKQHEILCDGPVFSLAPYGSNALVYCAGSTISFRTLDLRDKKWYRNAEIKLRCPTHSISVQEPFIYAATTEDSLSILQYKPNQLTVFASDEVARETLNHLVLPNLNLVLLSDRSCSLTGLKQPSQSRLQNATETLFEAELPRSITRLRIGSARYPADHASPSPVPGVLQGDIMGSSIDGAIFQFTVISEAAWRLLKFVQTLCERNPQLCYQKKLQSRYTTLEPQAKPARNMHVDGDILWRLLNHDGYHALQAMITHPPGDRLRFADLDSANARYARFEALTEALLGWKPQDPVRATMDYIAELLHSAL